MPSTENHPQPMNARYSINSGFPDRLRKYILKKHGSVNAFCRAAGIKYPAQMTPYLTGKCFPGKKMIARLEKDGADVPWLMDGNESSHATPDLSNALSLSQYRMDIDSLFRQVRMHISRFSALYKPVIDAYAVLDHNENIVDLSGSLEQYLGYKKNALTGTGLQNIIHPEDYLAVKRTLGSEMSADSIVEFKSKFRTGEGAYIDAEWCLAVNTKPMSELYEYAMILKGKETIHDGQ